MQKPDNNNRTIASKKLSSDTHKKLATVSLIQSLLDYAENPLPDHAENMPLSVKDLDNWIRAVSVEETEGEVDAGLMNLTRSERLVLKNVSPIHTLAGRISKPNLLIAQANMPEHDLLLSNSSIKIGGRDYELKEGLIKNLRIFSSRRS